MSISLIAAIDRDSNIGYENQLLFRFPNDLKRFKELTTGHYVLMGRKTFESIGHPLPNRHNIILTRNKDYQPPIGVYVYYDLQHVIKSYHNHNNDENDLFIIGGSDIYHQTIPFADKIYLTIIDTIADNSDSKFPKFSLDDWKVVETIHNKADEKHPHDYYYVTYERKTKL